MLIGYARISIEDTKLKLQREALKNAGCDKCFDDKTDDAYASPLEGLTKALATLRAGDTLVVWKLDRLGRSAKQLIDMIEELHKQDIHFKSLSDNIDTSTSSGKYFFHIMVRLAEMERNLAAERSHIRLPERKYRGGRKRTMSDEKINLAKRLMASGMPRKEVAQNLKVTLPTLYRWVSHSRTEDDKAPQ